jgi:hypothetical protein
MTLAAALTVNSYPVLIGDLLLSGPELSDGTIHIPTIGNINAVFPEGSGYSITGLSQKVCVVNDNLVVGWSGALVAAKLVIAQLIKEGAKRIFAFNDLKSFFERDLDPWCKNNLSMVGFSHDGKGIFSFGFSSPVIPTTNFGEVRPIGSGTDRFIPMLESFQTPFECPDVNPLEKAVGTVLAASTYMIGEEISMHSGLLHFYGGGFEMASWVGKRFQKIDDITYMFWHVIDEKNSALRLSMPKILLKFSYHKDMLLIRRVEHKGSRGNPLAGHYDGSVYLVGPICRSVSPDEIDQIMSAGPPTFNSRFICHFVIIERTDGTVEVLNRVTYSGSGGHPVRFVEIDQKLVGIKFRDDFFRSLLMTIKSGPLEGQQQDT